MFFRVSLKSIYFEFNDWQEDFFFSFRITMKRSRSFCERFLQCCDWVNCVEGEFKDEAGDERIREMAEEKENKIFKLQEIIKK